MNKLEIYVRGKLVETVDDGDDINGTCDVISIDKIFTPDGIVYGLDVYAFGDNVYESQSHGKLELDDVELKHIRDV